MHWPQTPVTSRCGFLRGRRRINPHPISELRRQENPQDRREPVGIVLEDLNYLSDDEALMESPEMQMTSNDSGFVTGDDIDN
ncbi:hypothetical protein KR009_003897, partial [Drosophila setifemur]